MISLAEARARVRDELSEIELDIGPWRDRNWDALADRLRERGLERLSVGQEIRLGSLIARLVQERSDFSSSEAIADFLVPVLAVSDDEAALVRREIAVWLRQSDSGRAAIVSTTPATGVFHSMAASGRFTVVALIAAALVALAVYLFVFFTKSAGPPSEVSKPLGPTAQSSGPSFIDQLMSLVPGGWGTAISFGASGLLLAVPVLLMLFVFLLVRERQRESILRRFGRVGDVRQLPVPHDSHPLLDEGAAQVVMRALRDWQHLRTVASPEIDVPQTIHATARNFGRPDWIFKTRRARPLYVFMVDRTGTGDHVELIARVIEERLTAAGLVFERYDFRDDPRRLWNAGKLARLAPPEDLSAVAARHRGERLLLLSDGDPFGGSVGEEFAAAMPMFSRAVMLDPTPELRWGEREETLIEAGLLVVPSSPEGFLRAIAAFGEEAEDARASATAAIAEEVDPFLAQLRRERSRYLGDVPLDERQTAKLVRQIRNYLAHENLYELFVAIAAFPQIDPAITLFLAKAVRNQPLDLREAGALARLPWLRAGRMPDWLRKALLESLPAPQAERLRRVLTAILDSFPDKPDQPLPDPQEIYRRSQIEIVAEPSFFDLLLGRLRGSGFGEHIFIGFMKREALSIDPPEILHLPWLSRLDRFDWAAIAVGVATAVLVFSLNAQLIVAFSSFSQRVPDWGLTVFALLTATVVSVHLLAHSRTAISDWLTRQLPRPVLYAIPGLTTLWCMALAPANFELAVVGLLFCGSAWMLVSYRFEPRVKVPEQRSMSALASDLRLVSTWTWFVQEQIPVAIYGTLLMAAGFATTAFSLATTKNFFLLLLGPVNFLNPRDRLLCFPRASRP